MWSSSQEGVRLRLRDDRLARSDQTSDKNVLMKQPPLGPCFDASTVGMLAFGTSHATVNWENYFPLLSIIVGNILPLTVLFVTVRIGVVEGDVEGGQSARATMPPDTGTAPKTLLTDLTAKPSNCSPTGGKTTSCPGGDVSPPDTASTTSSSKESSSPSSPVDDDATNVDDAPDASSSFVEECVDDVRSEKRVRTPAAAANNSANAANSSSRTSRDLLLWRGGFFLYYSSIAIQGLGGLAWNCASDCPISCPFPVAWINHNGVMHLMQATFNLCITESFVGQLRRW